jgi:hypothetical protein
MFSAFSHIQLFKIYAVVSSAFSLLHYHYMLLLPEIEELRKIHHGHIHLEVLCLGGKIVKLVF